MTIGPSNKGYATRVLNREALAKSYRKDIEFCENISTALGVTLLLSPFIVGTLAILLHDASPSL